MARKKRYWLFKSEPDAYSIDDLERDGTTYWDGVRNYQARNLLRDDIKSGDSVLFYHSREAPMGVVGVAKVTRNGYPDPTQFDKRSKYHDPKASKDEPRWFVVDVDFVRRLERKVTLTELKEAPGTAEMMVCRKGARLSVQPVEPAEFKAVLALAKRPG